MKNLSLGAKIWAFLFAVGTLAAMFNYIVAVALKYNEALVIYLACQGLAVFVAVGFIMNGKARLAQREKRIEHMEELLLERVNITQQSYLDQTTTNKNFKIYEGDGIAKGDQPLPLEEAERIGDIEWKDRMDYLKGKK